MFEFIITLILMVVGLIVSRKFLGTIRSPIGLFSIVWNGLYALSNLSMVTYKSTSLATSMVIHATYLSVLVGALTACMFLKNKKYSKKTYNIQFNHLHNTYTYKFLIKSINFSVIVSLLGTTLWLLKSIQIVGLSRLLTLDPYQVRYLIEGNVPTIISYMMVFSLGTSLLISLIISKGQKVKIIHFLGLIPPVTVSFFTGQRSLSLWMFLIFLLPIILIHKKKSSPKKNLKRKFLIIVMLCSLVALFIGVGERRGSFEDTTVYQSVFSNSQLTKTYIYLTGSFVALSEKMNTWDGQMNGGVSTFTPLFKVMNALRITNYDQKLLDEIVTGRDFVNIPFSFNVYTIVWDLISDFGIVGLIIFLWSVGLISTVLWDFSRKKRSVHVLDVIMILVTFYLVYGFISSITSFIPIWIGFSYSIFTIGLSKEIVLRKINYNNSEVTNESFSFNKITRNRSE
ncbi:MAG: hypothetical protein PME_10230 [Priestia megaterium]